jgi:carbon monoxide dehydrogenase subunit G
MHIEISHVVPHPIERVWDALLDPDVLRRALPGIEKFEPDGPNRFAVAMMLGVAAVRGRYTGTMEIVGQEPPTRYRLKGEGKGAPGWTKGVAELTLSTEDGGTRVLAKGDAQVGGTIAGVGQRMMEGVAKSMARDFFAALDRILAERTSA